MKMKDVCKQTGLTDRAVRLYVEEGLIRPKVEQGGWGRRSIDFSKEDIRCLEDIAVLRKFDFSIAQIRAILEDPQAGKFVLENVKQEKQRQAQMDQEMLTVLRKIDPNSTEKLSTMAAALRIAAQSEPLPDDKATEYGLISALFEMIALCVAFTLGLGAAFLVVDMAVIYSESLTLPFTVETLLEMMGRSGEIYLGVLLVMVLITALAYRIWIIMRYGRNDNKNVLQISAVVIDKEQNADAVVLSSFYSRNGGSIQQIVFKTVDGEILKLTAPADVYYKTKIGTYGALTYQGTKMLEFKPD